MALGSRKLKIGRILGNKRVLKFISQTGKRQYYRVECVLCGYQHIALKDSLLYKKDAKCRMCSTTVLRLKYDT